MAATEQRNRGAKKSTLILQFCTKVSCTRAHNLTLSEQVAQEQRRREQQQRQVDTAGGALEALLVGLVDDAVVVHGRLRVPRNRAVHVVFKVVVAEAARDARRRLGDAVNTPVGAAIAVAVDAPRSLCRQRWPP